MRRILSFTLPLAGAVFLCGAAKLPVPHPRPKTGQAVQQQAPAPAPTLEKLPDLSHAIPAREISKLPSTAEQFRALKDRIAKDKPALESAKQKSDALKAEALALQQQLIATAARVQDLEREKISLDADIVRLTARYETLSASFAHDRVSVVRLLAILERLQHDMPPAMVLKPDDALGAARSTMLIGASLPSVYGAAAALARRIDALQNTRLALIARRAEGARNTAQLVQARVDLDQLLARKQFEAEAATSQYGDLKTRLDAAAGQAADLATLLAKVAQLRAQPAEQAIVVVTAQKGADADFLKTASLRRPVVGRPVPGGLDGVGGASAPGMTFAAAPGARVIAPSDGQVLFAGPYHKSGQVLILEMTAGYDVVLAGMDRVNVRPEDQVLAGEPVGTMSNIGREERLYFELRRNGHGVNPAPWLAIELRKAQKL